MENHCSRQLKCLKLDFPPGIDVSLGRHFLSTESVLVLCILMNDKTAEDADWVSLQKATGIQEVVHMQDGLILP